MVGYRGTLDALKSGKRIVESTVTLNNGIQMPVLGFGTYLIRSDDIYGALDVALATGYRNIDTAAVYHNEEAIGAALEELLPKYNLSREDIFITTKLSPKDLGGNIHTAVLTSLKNLRTSYVDLYLIHWPGAQGIQHNSSENAAKRIDTWKKMIELHAGGQGVLKAIGVSNYLPRHLEETVQSTGVPPAINQVEFHPHFRHPDDMYTVCGKYSIFLQGYASLGGGNNDSLLSEKAVKDIAKRHEVTPAQVLLRWSLQSGYLIIPKSITPERIRTNAMLDFALSTGDMLQITSMTTRQKYSWNPINVA